MEKRRKVFRQKDENKPKRKGILNICYAINHFRHESKTIRKNIKFVYIPNTKKNGKDNLQPGFWSDGLRKRKGNKNFKKYTKRDEGKKKTINKNKLK